MLISLICNCLIVLMVLFAFCAMFFGWDFMGRSGKLQSEGTRMLRYFTVDSNILAGICSLITAAAELQVLTGKAASLSPAIYAIKLMGTSAVALTLVVTLFFLAPQFEKPILLYYNGNLFFHLIIPLVAIISFAGFERTSVLPLKAAAFGAVPTFFYAVYYLANVCLHLSNGRVDSKYDFYNFARGKMARIPIAFVAVLLVSYLISLLLWWGNGIGTSV